jgi:hypothetical protein
MEMADPDCGIFGATPVETLHAFCKGLVEMVTHVVIDNVRPSQKAALDRLALRFHKTHRQSFCSSFPSTTFCSGITNISKISAAECLGLVFLFVILGHYEEGWIILLSTLDNCHKKKEETVPAQKCHRYEPSFSNILQVFEAMLCFDKWLRKDTYWADDNAEVAKAIVSRLIAKLMHLNRTDEVVFECHMLSISDEAFLLVVVLIKYAPRWHVEYANKIKEVRLCALVV